MAPTHLYNCVCMQRSAHSTTANTHMNNNWNQELLQHSFTVLMCTMCFSDSLRFLAQAACECSVFEDVPYGIPRSQCLFAQAPVSMQWVVWVGRG